MDKLNKIKNIDSLKIISFNILFENPVDILAKPDTNNKKSWNCRKNHVSSLLKIYDSDIICLQECVITQLTYLKNEFLNEYNYFGAMSAENSKWHWSDINPIFFKKERFQLLDGGTFWLSDTPDVAGSAHYGNSIPRTFTWALLLDHINDTQNMNVFVVNTHLDVFSSESRNKSIKQISNFIKNVDFEYDFLVLTGDFNSHSDIFSELKKEPLNMVDSHDWADKSMKNVGTFNGFYGNSGNRIDYIFYRDSLNLISNAEYSVIEDVSESGNYVSDHYPVMAAFYYKPEFSKLLLH